MLYMLHMFSVLLASNIFMLSKFNAIKWFGSIHYAFSSVLYLFRSHFICFNKILQFYSYRSHVGFMLLIFSSAKQMLFNWATAFCGIHTVCNWSPKNSTCLFSLLSTWLKTVIPSVLTGKCHWFFLLTSLFLLRLLVIFLTLKRGCLKNIYWVHRRTIAVISVSEEYILLLSRGIFPLIFCHNIQNQQHEDFWTKIRALMLPSFG